MMQNHHKSEPGAKVPLLRRTLNWMGSAYKRLALSMSLSMVLHALVAACATLGLLYFGATELTNLTSRELNVRLVSSDLEPAGGGPEGKEAGEGASPAAAKGQPQVQPVETVKQDTHKMEQETKKNQEQAAADAARAAAEAQKNAARKGISQADAEHDRSLDNAAKGIEKQEKKTEEQLAQSDKEIKEIRDSFAAADKKGNEQQAQEAKQKQEEEAFDEKVKEAKELLKEAERRRVEKAQQEYKEHMEEQQRVAQEAREKWEKTKSQIEEKARQAAEETARRIEKVKQEAQAAQAKRDQEAAEARRKMEEAQAARDAAAAATREKAEGELAQRKAEYERRTQEAQRERQERMGAIQAKQAEAERERQERMAAIRGEAEEAAQRRSAEAAAAAERAAAAAAARKKQQQELEAQMAKAEELRKARGKGGTLPWETEKGLLQRDGLDIVLVFDSTESMGGEIAELKSRIAQMGNTLLKIIPKTRISVCAYRDEGEEYVTKGLPLTNDIGATERFLAGISAAGGGDIPEAVNKGLEWATDSNPFSQDAKKVILLFGDAPPHKKDMMSCVAMAKRFNRTGGYVSTVTCIRQKGQPPLSEFVEIANAGGGEAFSNEDSAEIVQKLVTLVFGSSHRDKVQELFRN